MLLRPDIIKVEFKNCVQKIVVHFKRYTFAREPLMAWCEDNHVDYLFGFARNTRLLAMIADELTAARATAEKTDQPSRRFKDFQWSFKTNAFWAPENFEPSSFFAPPGRGNREKL
ncbi:hypothetical protein ACM41_11810 [Bradyrhizobium sp. CCBAU 21362]|nr:hypothetical protein [Bradyrhizobium sp. CCBAU 11361]MDA9536944.1 hypothetical protein [Bradyrhizobium sp. CCBAU 21362]